MKKTILSKIALHVLMLAGVFCFASLAANAQNSNASVNDPLWQEPKGPFLEANLASQILDEELSTLKTSLGTLEPGTVAYNLADWKYVYYNGVRNYIANGRTVSQSIVMALDVYNAAPYNTVPESQRTGNKNALIQLLKA